MIVQGDVFFTRAKKLPVNAEVKQRSNRGYIIADGEATGHAHVVDDDVELLESDGILYLKTAKEIQVKHEEHKPVILSKGIWKVGIVKEYDPFSEEARPVRD